ncbi:mediator of RNA polymerase II transcription subunit 10 [Teratosphaeria destructans]|uniref:Mediator of RNA polymerase II transcription subunit 10 n=1 Tax=Teratosphaeria destructans TaxID=418781 RepID=A0A9W7SXS3_9PEZI|nr:mediator of RNA polymerase II transcription subunit 10 [Teratosphaeria destructans]
MAAQPLAPDLLTECEKDLTKIIENLYLLILQTHDHQGPNTQTGIAKEIKSLLQNLVELSKKARHLPTQIPVEVIEYVEGSRNPDIYTREFVELVMRLNQELKGKSQAFASFRDILGREMASAIPEIQTEVRQVVQSTGGKLEP